MKFSGKHYSKLNLLYRSVYDCCGSVHRAEGDRENDPGTVARTTDFISKKILEPSNRRLVVMPWTKVPFVFMMLSFSGFPTIRIAVRNADF